MSIPRPVQPLARLLAPLRSLLIAAVVLQAVSSVAAVVSLIALAEAVRALLVASPDEDKVWVWVAVCGTTAPVSLLAASAAVTLTHVGDARLQLRLRRALADRLGRVPLGWFARRGSGEVKKVVHDDVHAMHYLVAHTLLDITAVIVVPVTALVYLIVVDWRLGLLSVVPLVAGIWLFARAMAEAGTKMADYGRAAAEINNAVVEFVDGIAVVKTFGRARSAYERFGRAADAFHDFFSRWVAATTAVTTASQIVVAPPAVLLLVLGPGIALVVHGGMPAPEIIPFALLAPGVAGAVSNIGTRLQALRTGGVAAASVAGLLDTPPLPVLDTPRTTDGATADRATVELRGASFAYDGGPPVLDGIDLVLAPGTVTALVGVPEAGDQPRDRRLARPGRPDQRRRGPL
ncbi:hypothetical protein KBI5_17820, partial [Frankia sp. KB5]